MGKALLELVPVSRKRITFIGYNGRTEVVLDGGVIEVRFGRGRARCRKEKAGDEESLHDGKNSVG